MLNNSILVVLFISAAITDLTSKKIYNVQTYPAMLCGLILGFVSEGVHGALVSFGGLLVGLGLLMVLYLVGGMGAGDVKLLGAIGALKGASFVLWTMFYTGLVGGFMALAVIIWHGTARATLRNVLVLIRHPFRAQQEQQEREQHYLPYGFAISLGCLWALITL